MDSSLLNAIEHWAKVEPVLHKPRTEEEYRHLLEQIEQVMKVAGNNPHTRLHELIEIMAKSAHEYEQENIVETTGGGVAALKFLMRQHRLRQVDLPEVGTQGVVSEILNGKRSLSVRHIKALSQRFHLSPATFFD